MNSVRDFYNKRASFRPQEIKRHYHRLIHHYYRYFIPKGARVLEAGCGIGDLLSDVEPAEGVGVDISPQMIEIARNRHPNLRFVVADILSYESEEKFDYIVASDLINDLSDVQAFFERLHQFSTPRTRLVLNFYNHLWRPVLAIAEKLGFKSPTPPQNWLSLSDVKNLLALAKWDVVHTETKILLPIKIPLISSFVNRWISPLLRNLCLSIFVVARQKPELYKNEDFSCSIIVPCRNEAGNIEEAVKQIPQIGKWTEIIFVEGHSKDNTWDEIQRVKTSYPDKRIIAIRQSGSGKANAVREGFEIANGDFLIILDADLTVPPADIAKFYSAAKSGVGEFINGVRLVYPMEKEAMQFLNMLANKMFSLAFTWLLGHPIKDTLCGTKALFKSDYIQIAKNRSYFGEFDPFGDFDLLFGAKKLNLKIVDLPVRYRSRSYGKTNIHRWRHGWLLLKMVIFAAKRLKFI
ncbi:MAG: glycosyltransferase [Verrucomicrobiia bacterium]|jgi:SAM-dependent methyltransferase